jgi:hypothetical protein
MSACMRSLNSSDQWAPGFNLLLLFGCGDLAHGCANGVEGAATESPEGESESRLWLAVSSERRDARTARPDEGVAPGFSVRVGRDDEGLEEEFDSLIRRVMAPLVNWLRWILDSSVIVV